MFSKESVRVQTEQSTQVVSYVGKVMKCHCERQRWPLSTRRKEGASGFISSSLLVMTSLLNLVEANVTPSGEMPKGQAGERPAPTSRLDKVYAEKNRYFVTVTNRGLAQALGAYGAQQNLRAVDLIARSVYHTVERSTPQAVVVPTRSGNTARRIARFRLPCWVITLSPCPATSQAMQFSYGIYAVDVNADRGDWSEFVRDWLAQQGIVDGLVLLTQGPSDAYPCGNHRLEIIELDPTRERRCH